MVGASYGASVLYDRRDDQTVFDDEVIEFQARDAYLKNPDISKHSQLKVTSYNYTALITGQVETVELSDRFAHVVSQLPKVKQVYNEAEIAPMISLKQLTTDTYLTSRAKLNPRVGPYHSVRVSGFRERAVERLGGGDMFWLSWHPTQLKRSPGMPTNQLRMSWSALPSLSRG